MRTASRLSSPHEAPALRLDAGYVFPRHRCSRHAPFRAAAGPARRPRVHPGYRRHAPGPGSGRLADVAPHPEHLGFQSPRPDRPRQRRRPPDGLDPSARPRPAAGHAARLRRRPLHAEPARHHPGDRRGERRPDLGAPPRPARRPGRLHDRQSDRHQPQHRHPRQLPLRQHVGRLGDRDRRADRRRGVGDEGARLHRQPGQPDVRPDRRRRQGDLRPELRAEGRPERLRHRRPRRRNRRGAVAPPPHPGSGRVRRRDLGRRSVRGTQARRCVDGPELRPGAEPGLRRHVGHLTRAEVHDRRRRQHAPLPQLDPRAERRHRRDRVVLPASERPLGSRPSVRAACWWTPR